MDRPPQSCQLYTSSTSGVVLPWTIRLVALSVFFIQAGCASFNLFKKEDDEYRRARNAIEGYEDKEGNWVRPEGIRADKARVSSLPKALHFIPGIGPKPVNKDLSKSTYQEADDLFRKASQLSEDSGRQSMFRAAAEKYKVAGSHWASSALEQDSLLMAGESYFFAEDYSKAEDRYQKLVKEYPRTRYQDLADKRRMEIATFWLQFPDKFYHLNVTDNRKPWNDTKNHGVRVLEKIRLDNPVGRLADDVTMELANTAFGKGNWNDALDTYSDLISTYPDSPHQFDAHFLGIKSALQSYQGADYSQEPLDKAEKMIKQLVRQFPEKAANEKKQIEDAAAEVRYRKAEREFVRATYRFNKREARAARTHCTKILTDYADTPFAEKVNVIMEKTGGMPAEPVQELSWLADLFPNRDKITPLLKPTPNQDELDKKVQDLYERTAGKTKPKGVDASGSIQR